MIAGSNFRSSKLKFYRRSKIVKKICRGSKLTLYKRSKVILAIFRLSIYHISNLLFLTLIRRSKVYKWFKILFIFRTKSILNFWNSGCYLYKFLEKFWSFVKRQFWTSEIWPYDQSPSLKNVTYLMFQVLNWWLMETGESTNENNDRDCDWPWHWLCY